MDTKNPQNSPFCKLLNLQVLQKKNLKTSFWRDLSETCSFVFQTLWKMCPISKKTYFEPTLQNDRVEIHQLWKYVIKTWYLRHLKYIIKCYYNARAAEIVEMTFFVSRLNDKNSVIYWSFLGNKKITQS